MKFKKLPAILMAIITLMLISAYIMPSADISGVVNLSDSTVTDSSKVTYTCPMHPEVISDNPGQCPKCGMDLIKKEKESKDEGMKNCPDMKQCKKIGCDMNQCKGESGGCTDKCPVMKNNKSKEHDHNSKDNDDNSGGHKHKSGCSKKGC